VTGIQETSLMCKETYKEDTNLLRCLISLSFHTLVCAVCKVTDMEETSLMCEETYEEETNLFV